MTVFSELFIRQNSYNRSICTCYSCSALLAGREQQVREYLCISVRARRLEPWRHGVHVGGRHFGGTRGHHRSDDQLQAGDLWWVRPPQIFKLHGHWKSSQRNLFIFFFSFSLASFVIFFVLQGLKVTGYWFFSEMKIFIASLRIRCWVLTNFQKIWLSLNVVQVLIIAMIMCVPRNEIVFLTFRFRCCQGRRAGWNLRFSRSDRSVEMG